MIKKLMQMDPSLLNDKTLIALYNACQRIHDRRCSDIEKEYRRRFGRSKRSSSDKRSNDDGIILRIQREVEREKREEIERIIRRVVVDGRVLLRNEDGEELVIVKEECFRWSGAYDGWGCDRRHIYDILVAFFARPRVRRALRDL